MPISTPKELQEHLELAIKIELSTIPPYLFAMYSLEDQGSEAALLLRSIVAEEMLHAVLASNLLLAVGGRPPFASRRLIPTYPGLVPHHVPPLELRLEPCSQEQVREVFMRIEQPEVYGAPPEPDMYETLGQFYHALESAITGLAEAHDLFADPQAESQLADPSFYSPVAYDAEDSGTLVLVDSPESALEAIEIIVHQGEGLGTERWADPSHQELTHYYKLVQIETGVSPIREVLPVASSPRSSDYPVPLRRVSDLFNAGYRYLYLLLDDLFQPSRDKTAHVGRLYRLMTGVMSPVALFLVRQPLGGGTNAAPTFEVHEFSTDPEEELAALASGAADAYPELADVAAAVQW